jgi:alkylation response protein AidB-like acyl-CoA dehydrogenase
LDTFVPRYDEIRFALRAWAGLPNASADDAGDLIDAVVDEAGRFASQVLAPIDQAGEREGCTLENNRVRMPAGWADAYRKFVDAEWNTVHFAASVGGQGLPTSVSIAVAEMFNAANVAFCLGLMPFAGVVALLEKFGTERQKRLYLPALVSGRWTATLAITEPQAGTDLGAIRTKAVPDQAGYRIFGQKIFITYGEHDLSENIVHFILARDPSGVTGAKGLSLYIASKFDVRDDGSLGPRNDVTCVALEKKIGIHASPTASLVFGDNGGAVAERLGEENRGLEHMFVVLNRARLNIGVFGLASAERAYQVALAYAQERIQGTGADGKPCAIIRHPDVRRMVLDMRSCVDAMRALAYYTASLIDRAAAEPDSAERSDCQRQLDLLTPVAKGWITETAFQVASTGVQVAGGAGYVAESAAAQCFLEARVHTIYEGTTGVQAADLVFRKVMRDNGIATFALLDGIRMMEGMVLHAKDGGFKDLWPILARAVHALAAATNWIVQQRASDRQRLEAVSVHYLNLCGNTVGAWLLLRGAIDANAELASNRVSVEFAADKGTAARFFVIHRLLPACSLAEVMMHGAEPVLDYLP